MHSLEHVRNCAFDATAALADAVQVAWDTSQTHPDPAVRRQTGELYAALAVARDNLAGVGVFAPPPAQPKALCAACGQPLRHSVTGGYCVNPSCYRGD